MPVTAKLSLKFYEKLGEDVANELVEWFNQVDATYRADLRELNELNFARFDAKLEQRIAEVKAQVHEEILGLEGRLEGRLDQRFGGRFQSVDERFQQVDERFERLEKQIRTLETRVEVGFATLRADMVKWLFGMWITLLGAMVALTKLA